MRRLTGPDRLGFAASVPGVLIFLLAFLGEGGVSAAPSSNGDCATLVPLQEVLRGKSAFLSGCETLSETSNLGGCWTQTENDDTTGCQTCYIAEDIFAGTVFPAMFSEELDPCPSNFDYAVFHEQEHGDLSLVTLASLTSSGCPDGWLYSSDTGHCYFKSLNTAKAADQADAVVKCKEEGAWVIAVDTEAENSFMLNNLLWLGFFGETYTGMVKEEVGADWVWPEAAEADSKTPYNCLADFSDWMEGVEIGCESSYNDGADGSSCMEIFPYEPKGWNPFSCNVGKHYVCEMPSSGLGEGDTPVVTPPPTTTAPSTTPTAAPTQTLNVTAAPSAATMAPSVATFGPSVAPTVSPTGVTQPPFSSTAGNGSTGSPTVAPTVEDVVMPTSSQATPGGTASPSTPGYWEGDHLLSVTKRGLWSVANYSLYLVEGDMETPVAEDLTKIGLGTQEDDYSVKTGCYRLQISTDEDPTVLTWDVTGGDPFRSSDQSSGEGLDGTLLTVGGGVCDVGECHALCLADYFSTEGDGGVASSNGACDGYRALIAGTCSDICSEEEGEDTTLFQEKCVSSKCDAETVCGVDRETSVLGIENVVKVTALLEGGKSTTSMNAQGEFQSAVASWLGVDSEDVTVTAINGFDIEEEAEEEGEVEQQNSRALRQLASRVWQQQQQQQPVERHTWRKLQSDSSSSSPGYTRYTCRVHPENATVTEAGGMQAQAVEGGSAAALEALLLESGGSWSEASVVEVDAEVLQGEFVVSGASIGAEEGDTQSEGQGDKSWYKDDPLATGGVAAGAVVLLGLLIIAFCMYRHKSTKKCVAACLPVKKPQH